MEPRHFAPLVHILAILTWMDDELRCGQAQNGVNLGFQVKFDLGGQGQSLHKTIGILTKVFCIFDPNLVILAWTGPDLSRGQASDWHTDTDTQTQATTIHEGQSWLRLIKWQIITVQEMVWLYPLSALWSPNLLIDAHKRHQLKYTRGPFTKWQWQWKW